MPLEWLGTLPVWALLAMLFLGACASRPALQVPPDSLDSAGAPGSAVDSLGRPSEPITDLGDDVVGVLVDSLNTPTFDVETPEIPDSVAAATQAKLATADEIFDYPVVVNRRVLAWIDRYTGRMRSSFERSLQRSGRYLPMARRVFAEHGIPQDLAFVAHVESGFRHNAVSRVRAMGLWQFMRGTAVEYGMRCDSFVDERIDPVRATAAAATYLRVLYGMYDDWYLALAAYNAGPGTVNSAIRRSGKRDFWEIAETRYLKNETRNFVPAILAATILAKSPGAYGLTEETEPPLQFETLEVDIPTDLRVLSECSRVPLEELRALNPALRYLQTPPHEESFVVYVPVGTAELASAELALVPPEKRLIFHRHRVRPGDTLGALARQFGTSVRSIQASNQLGRSTLIRVGDTLLIPAHDAGTGSGGQASHTGPAGPRAEETLHTVRRGETLGGLARTYGVSAVRIQQHNRIPDPRRVRVGQTLRIPPNATRTEARTADLAQARGDGDARDATSSPPTPAQADTEELGRVSSTLHLVDEARLALEAEAEAEAAAEAENAAAAVRSDSQSSSSAQAPASRFHRVRRGDSPWSIAHAHGVTVSQLRAWNGLGRGEKIYPGQELRVSDPILQSDSANGSSAASRGDEPRVHVVSRGDTLWDIARRYGVRVGDLASWNGISSRTAIHPGQRIRVY